jgi:hypothetical protein
VAEIEYTELEPPHYDQASQLVETSALNIPESALATPMREVSETPQRPTIGRKEPARYSPE